MPARDAWKLILELVGWGFGPASPRPRFPVVAEQMGFAPKQLGVLMMLPEGTSRPMGELGSQLHCDASYVTDLVDRLEERGLIERGSDPDDRRVKRITATEAGLAVRAEAIELIHEPPADLTSLPRADQHALAALLEKARVGTP